MHEKLLHLILVRRDMAHFAHEHPTLDPMASSASATPSPPAATTASSPTSPQRARAPRPSTRPFPSAGKPQAPAPLPSELADLVSTSQVPVRRTVPVTVQIKDPANLEPYLGALGHLILIHEDAETFVHSHPDDRAASPGTLVFLARFPKPGVYRGWLQFQRAGKVFTSELRFEAAQ